MAGVWWARVGAVGCAGVLAIAGTAGAQAPAAGEYRLSTAVAAEAGGIEGQVVAERTGEPLAGALVTVREAGVRAYADEAGRFRIENLRAGAYTVEVSLLGRTHAAERVSVAAGRLSPVEIRLGVAPVQLEALSARLERTELVGRELTRVPGSAHVLGAERLSGQRLAFDDVHTLLRQVPGVNVVDEEGHGRRPNIGLRGTGVGRSAKVTIMEDGVLAAPAPYSAPAAYLFPVVGRMEALEVRKGSSQVKYGPWSTGGALNLVSASVPARFDGLAEVAGGGDGNGRLRARVGSAHGVLGWLLETYQLRTDGFKQLDGGGDTGFRLSDYVAKLRLNSGAGARLYQDVELKLVRTTEASRETYLGLADEDFAATPLRRYAGTQRDRLDTEASQIQLRHFIRPTSAFDVTTTVYHNDFARTWYKLDRMAAGSLGDVLTNPAQAGALDVLRGGDSGPDALIVRSNARDYTSRGVQAVLGTRLDLLATTHALEFGARLHYDSESRFQHDDRYSMTGGRMELTTAGAPGSQDNRMAEATAYSLFAENRITAGVWTLTPGVRYENIEFVTTRWANGDAARTEQLSRATNAVEAWVPGIGISRLAGRHAQLFAGVHRGFGPPGAGADERTRPESSVNFELGGRLDAPGARLQLAGFHNDYANILGRATLASGDSLPGEIFNGGSALVQGLEASAEYDLARYLPTAGTRVPLRAAYTWTRAEFRSAFQSGFGEWGTVQAGDALPYLPTHQGSASIGVETARWNTSLQALASGAMRTRAGSGALEPAFSTDAFTVLNLAGEFHVTAWTSLFASVQNVTDATYVVARRPFGARPGLPRTFTLGARATVR